jgi:hypothetical protein
VREAIERLETPLLAASRARSLRLGPVGEDAAQVAVAGVRVEIVLGAAEGAAPAGAAGKS